MFWAVGLVQPRILSFRVGPSLPASRRCHHRHRGPAHAYRRSISAPPDYLLLLGTISCFSCATLCCLCPCHHVRPRPDCCGRWPRHRPPRVQRGRPVGRCGRRAARSPHARRRGPGSTPPQGACRGGYVALAVCDGCGVCPSVWVFLPAGTSRGAGLGFLWCVVMWISLCPCALLRTGCELPFSCVVARDLCLVRCAVSAPPRTVWFPAGCVVLVVLFWLPLGAFLLLCMTWWCALSTCSGSHSLGMPNFSFCLFSVFLCTFDWLSPISWAILVLLMFPSVSLCTSLLFLVPPSPFFCDPLRFFSCTPPDDGGSPPPGTRACLPVHANHFSRTFCVSCAILWFTPCTCTSVWR